MIQEIITYLIIGTAVMIVVLKTRKKFWKKTKNTKTVSQINKSFPTVHKHNCSDCSAECILRDAAKPIIQNNRDLCRKIETSALD